MSLFIGAINDPSEVGAYLGMDGTDNVGNFLRGVSLLCLRKSIQ